MLQGVLAIGLWGALPLLCNGCPCCSPAADDAEKTNQATLGAQTRAPTTDEAKTYQLTELAGKAQGQLCTSVDRGSGAERAGLNAGDMLLALDANKVFSRDDVEDFLRISSPGVQVKVLVKRGGTYREETVAVTLGAERGGTANKHFSYEYAGLGQLDAALVAAKKERKLVLVGLSGADT